MKVLKCRDAGFDCNHVIRAKTDDEVLTKAATHAKSVHGLKTVDEKTVRAIKSRIRVE